MDASPSPACQLFRECLRGVLQQMWTEEWPDRLCTSSLVPIPKGAATTNPGQYRGIAGSHIITKLHELILFERADRVSEQHNLRSPTQCGFRKGKGTLDATVTLQHLVARARHQKQRLYVTFVDFDMESLRKPLTWYPGMNCWLGVSDWVCMVHFWQL